jgi:branched-chain amino acid transport system ATP-binding protein
VSGLEVQGLAAGYGEVRVLHGLNLEVGDGELVALVGANGAGKSTLLRCVSGLLRPEAGEIGFAGRRLDRLAPADIVGLGVAHVPERRQIFGQLTVGDNLRLGAYRRLRGLGRDGLERRVAEVCALFPALAGRLDEDAARLSGGQQQMLAIARGLMLEPRLLLLDEPSLGLAPMVVHEIFEMLGRLRETKIAILLVEQNAALSLAIADRAYVIENGRIVLSGTGPDLLHREEVVDRYLGVDAGARGGAEPDAGLDDLASRLRKALATGPG